MEKIIIFNVKVVKKIINKAFTLVEVVVSITIFSMVIVSVIWIYITSSDILVKSEINRKMQENLKNVSSQITEDVRNYWIQWLSSIKWESYDRVVWSNRYKEGTWLYTKAENKYYLALLEPTTWSYIRVNSSDCSLLKTRCVIYRLSSDPLNSWPLTNSFVSIRDLKFYLSLDKVPKLTMIIITQPSVKKWVKADLIKQSKIIFQTTVSERPF